MQALSHKHNMKEAKIPTFAVSKYLSPPSGAICTRKNNAQFVDHFHQVMCMWDGSTNLVGGQKCAYITKMQTHSRKCVKIQSAKAIFLEKKCNEESKATTESNYFHVCTHVPRRPCYDSLHLLTVAVWASGLC